MRFAPHGGKLGKPDGPGVDPTNQDEFTRPVTLHRRDPRQPPPGREVKEEAPTEEETVDTAEAERLAQVKAEREAQRAADNAQKAPVVKDANPKAKQQKEQKKPGLQIHYAPRTEEQKKQAEIRYEEALPWHLEDADGKNVWVGQYEAPLSDCKVAFKIHNGGFRMIPLEKWYKFQSKRGSFKIMSIEEAEKAMNKKVALGRWAVRDTQRQEAERAMAESRAMLTAAWLSNKKAAHSSKLHARRRWIMMTSTFRVTNSRMMMRLLDTNLTETKTLSMLILESAATSSMPIFSVTQTRSRSRKKKMRRRRKSWSESSSENPLRRL